MPDTDLANEIAAERRELAAMLAALPESDWDASSLLRRLADAEEWSPA